MLCLEELCKELEIPVGSFDYEPYREFEHDNNDFLNNMASFSNSLNHNLIFIGGQTLRPELLGFRYMRSLGGDFDCVSNLEGIKILSDKFRDNNLIYFKEHEDLALEYNNFSVEVNFDKIHDFPVKQDFFDVRN
ncbi:MAG: hypothetical protein Q7S33_01895 [Nanoarchaeota archaeon]|nr:hypothetical protein [Nanoarchaeota archaeon]